MKKLTAAARTAAKKAKNVVLMAIAPPLPFAEGVATITVGETPVALDEPFGTDEGTRAFLRGKTRGVILGTLVDSEGNEYKCTNLDNSPTCANESFFWNCQPGTSYEVTVNKFTQTLDNGRTVERVELAFPTLEYVEEGAEVETPEA